MRVVFDHQCFQDQAAGGVSRYASRLVEALRASPGVTVTGWAGWHLARPPAGFGGRRVGTRWLSGMTAISRLARLGNAIRFERWARRREAEVYHATYYRSFRVPEGWARVVTAHDCIHELFPDTGGNELAMKREAFARADAIICVSERTRADVIKYYGVREDKLAVVHHGGGLGVAAGGAAGAAGAAPLRERPYVLYVGRRDGYKNFELLLRLWAEEPSLREACDLVCVGGEPGSQAMRQAGIVWVERASDAELAQWYAAATALVYPSRYEGFGLPVLEAMEAGCPVITTRCGAIPEAAGDAACYCDPDDGREWAGAIRRLLTHGDERAIWAARGRQRAGRFSWSRCAGETLAVYEKARTERARARAEKGGTRR
ncbi:MAG: glycosyltransferase family 4 protein [Opitutaceae bacterium]|jgi:glycosyltransferase involved in cell wall biosynthesis|nr:glycosyltransferase family 4 protein [Opitutaceae bacterium]